MQSIHDSFTLFFAGAVYRYYESRRRLHNDSQPRRKKKVEQNKKKPSKESFSKEGKTGNHTTHTNSFS